MHWLQIGGAVDAMISRRTGSALAGVVLSSSVLVGVCILAVAGWLIIGMGWLYCHCWLCQGGGIC